MKGRLVTATGEDTLRRVENVIAHEPLESRNDKVAVADGYVTFED